MWNVIEYFPGVYTKPVDSVFLALWLATQILGCICYSPLLQWLIVQYTNTFTSYKMLKIQTQILPQLKEILYERKDFNMKEKVLNISQNIYS